MTIVTATGPDQWRKSKACAINACVEVDTGSDAGSAVRIRNSTAPAVTLAFERAAWRQFISDIRGV